MRGKRKPMTPRRAAETAKNNHQVNSAGNALPKQKIDDATLKAVFGQPDSAFFMRSCGIKLTILRMVVNLKFSRKAAKRVHISNHLSERGVCACKS